MGGCACARARARARWPQANALNGVDTESTPDDKLRAVMIGAKERGLTVPQIFAFFMGDGEDDVGADGSASPKAVAAGERMAQGDDDFDGTEITPERFRAALEKLGPRIFVVTDGELAALISVFDEDGNGMISLVEFRSYCYRIPHLAWKVGTCAHSVTHANQSTHVHIYIYIYI